MTKNLQFHSSLPAPVRETISQLGEHIRLARKRRDMTQRDLAQKMFVGVQTVVRLERGDPSVSLSIVLTALFCLQLDYDLAALASPDRDDIGNSLDQRRHEERRLVRPRRNPDNLDF